jgi:histidinol-phosphate aminotransferase
MFIKKKPHLQNIKRMRVSEGRDLKNGLRLDRNEKVDIWPENFLQQVFGNKPGHFLSVYPESSCLYKKLAEFHCVGIENIALSSGIDGALKSIFEIMTSPGDVVGVLSPTYAMYKIYSNLFQVELREIGYNEDLSLDLNQLKVFLKTKPSVLFIPNPNQPIESSLTNKEIKEIAQIALENDVLLVIDEAYALFGCETAIPLIIEYQNLVITRTFSKAFGVPSIRLGYMLSNPENIEILSKTRLAHESNSVSNAIAEYLLDHYEIVDNYIQEVIQGREFVRRELERLGFDVHGGAGNYLLIDLKNPALAEKIVIELRNSLVYVKGPWSPPWNKYITITVGPTHLMQRFLDVFAKVAK